jgi:hypothetical protein
MCEDARIKALNYADDQPCSCTNEQESGKDPTMCRSCMAGSALNRIGEIISDEYREVFDS